MTRHVTACDGRPGRALFGGPFGAMFGLPVAEWAVPSWGMGKHGAFADEVAEYRASVVDGTWTPSMTETLLMCHPDPRGVMEAVTVAMASDPVFRAEWERLRKKVW